MNQALFPASTSFALRSTPSEAPTRSRSRARAREEAWRDHEMSARLRRLRSLLGLFSLYMATLLIMSNVSDGADLGCILAGVAGHAFYAAFRIGAAWRDAAGLQDAMQVYARSR